ncbi:MAG: hypothetical protein GC178_09315 [Flavobacteriales bacterium]|nr:hypothetical protein [Flavobacteriales bacterium]
MKLHIDDKRIISAIQEEFSKGFPYLKIEFFKKPHEAGETSAKEDMLPTDSPIGKWRTAHNEGELTITKDSTVAEVESGFQEKFGIAVQVFRRSGKVWLETSATDGWTLSEQNDQAAFMEQEVG